MKNVAVLPLKIKIERLRGKDVKFKQAKLLIPQHYQFARGILLKST